MYVSIVHSMCVWCSLFWTFVYFKQKTAYELRISDWSSDVCSSDLASSAKLIRRDPQLFANDRSYRANALDWEAIKRTERATKGEARTSQIGRAPCRERVCQYV